MFKLDQGQVTAVVQLPPLAVAKTSLADAWSLKNNFGRGDIIVKGCLALEVGEGVQILLAFAQGTPRHSWTEMSEKKMQPADRRYHL